MAKPSSSGVESSRLVWISTTLSRISAGSAATGSPTSSRTAFGHGRLARAEPVADALDAAQARLGAEPRQDASAARRPSAWSARRCRLGDGDGRIGAPAAPHQLERRRRRHRQPPVLRCVTQPLPSGRPDCTPARPVDVRAGAVPARRRPRRRWRRSRPPRETRPPRRSCRGSPPRPPPGARRPARRGRRRPPAGRRRARCAAPRRARDAAGRACCSVTRARVPPRPCWRTGFALQASSRRPAASAGPAAGSSRSTPTSSSAPSSMSPDAPLKQSKNTARPMPQGYTARPSKRLAAACYA